MQFKVSRMSGFESNPDERDEMPFEQNFDINQEEEEIKDEGLKHEHQKLERCFSGDDLFSNGDAEEIPDERTDNVIKKPYLR